MSNREPYESEVDRYNTVTFDPVRTKALRLEARLREEYSAGIMEWKSVLKSFPEVEIKLWISLLHQNPPSG